MAGSSTSGKRLAFLDWTRGFAACIMLQGHVFQSFAHKDLRSDSPYVLSQFFGGLTPAVFLFVTGVTLAFLMDSQSRQPPSARATGRTFSRWTCSTAWPPLCSSWPLWRS